MRGVRVHLQLHACSIYAFQFLYARARARKATLACDLIDYVIYSKVTFSYALVIIMGHGNETCTCVCSSRARHCMLRPWPSPSPNCRIHPRTSDLGGISLLRSEVGEH